MSEEKFNVVVSFQDENWEESGGDAHTPVVISVGKEDFDLLESGELVSQTTRDRLCGLMVYPCTFPILIHGAYTVWHGYIPEEDGF